METFDTKRFTGIVAEVVSSPASNEGRYPNITYEESELSDRDDAAARIPASLISEDEVHE